MSLIRATITVGGWTALSRLFGLVRDVLAAALLGAGPIGDAFLVASKIPNFFRRLFAEGAFNAAFVPLFAGMMETEGRRAALRFAEEVLAVLLAVLLAITAFGELTMSFLMYGLAPGFHDDPVRLALSIELTCITFPYLLCMSLASLASGVLNSLDRFWASAATSTLFNLVTIVTLLGLTPWLPTAGHALAWGILASGIVQFVWLALALNRAGADLRLRWPRSTAGIGKLMRLMIPGAIGAGVVQVNLVIDVMIASLLPVGSISFLYYADRVAQLPLGVVGTAIGTALLPLMSRQLRSGQVDAAITSQNRAIEIALALTIPATVGLMLLARPIMLVLFQRGEFGPLESDASAGALAAFSLGLPAYVLVKVLTPAFFARHDTATPVRIAIGALVINVALNLLLMRWYLHVGIALATAIAAWVNAGCLAVVLSRRGLFRADALLRRRLIGQTLATAAMAGGVAAGAWGLSGWLGTDPIGGIIGRAGALGALIAGGVTLFFLAAHLTGGLDLGDIRRLARRGRG